MFAFKPRKSLTMLLALLLLILAACGGAAPEPAPALEPTETAEPTVKAPPTEAPAPEPTEVAEPTVKAPPTEATEAPPTETAEPIVESIVEPKLNLLDTLEADGRFGALIDALQSSDNLLGEIENIEPVTLFAPTDEAFEKLPPETLDALFSIPELEQTLLYHVLEKPMKAEELSAETEPRNDNGTPIAQLPTIQGDTVTIAKFDEELKVNNANIIQSDIETQNGSIIHVIDIMLQPVGLVSPATPDNLDENIEAWEPYEEGEPLSIGDAELVPGAEQMREGIRALRDVLEESGVQINIARTIRLEAHGDIYYLAPIGLEAIQNQDPDALTQEQGLIVGVLVIDNQQPIEERAFVTRLLSKENGSQEWSNEWQLSNGEVVATGNVSLTADDMEMGEIPSAAMLYGSHLCKYWFRWSDNISYHPCFYCDPFSDDDTPPPSCH